MNIVKLDSEGWKNLPDGVSAENIIAEAERGAKEASKLLVVSDSLNIIVIPNLAHVIDVTGTGASTYGDELIDITFDPKRASSKGFMKDIYASVFHEINHAARFYAGIKHKDYLQLWVLEGLATVFEKQYTYYQPGWGKYDAAETKAWLKEVQAMDEKQVGAEYWYEHPDGRRWIGYKVGTWIVDEAIKNSGKTVIELTTASNEEILEASRVL